MISTREEYHVGQPVVYVSPKQSEPPFVIPNAERNNKTQIDTVEKYRAIDQVRNDGRLALRSRTGKVYLVDSADGRLRPATAWESSGIAISFHNQWCREVR